MQVQSQPQSRLNDLHTVTIPKSPPIPSWLKLNTKQSLINHIFNNSGNKKTLDVLLKEKQLKQIWSVALENELGHLVQGFKNCVKAHDTHNSNFCNVLRDKGTRNIVDYFTKHHRQSHHKLKYHDYILRGYNILARNKNS